MTTSALTLNQIVTKIQTYGYIAQFCTLWLPSLRDDGSISLVNRTLQEWLGYPFGELQGQPMDMLLPAASRIFYQTHLFPLLRIQGHAEEVYFPLHAR